jgi:hypothetical protein
MRWVVEGAKHAEDRNRHLEFIKALQPVFFAIQNFDLGANATARRGPLSTITSVDL